MTTFEIIVTPAAPFGRGRFVARLGGRVLLPATRQPLLDCARVLLGEGASPTDRIEMRHDGSPHVALRSTIAAAAKLTVEEGPDRGPVLVLWRDRPFPGGSPPSAFAGDTVPDSPPTGEAPHG